MKGILTDDVRLIITRQILSVNRNGSLFNCLPVSSTEILALDSVPPGV